MATSISEAWLPIGCMLRAPIVSVRWIEFGLKELSEPFFQQTIHALRSRRPPAPECITDVQQLLARARQYPPVIPSGVICHVSRCGSTLIANALRAGRDAVVLSEMPGLSMLMSRGPNAPIEGGELPELRSQVVSAFIRLYAYHRGAITPKLFVKCNAVSGLDVAAMRATWPETPFILVIRDPVEVTVSNIERPAGWIRAKHIPLGRRSAFGWTAAEMQEMSEEEYCARGLGRLFEALAEQVDEKCRVLDYARVDMAMLYDVAHFFGVELPPPHDNRMKVLRTQYAKDPSQDRTFTDDTAEKQRRASETMRRCINQWAYRPYEKLKALQVWGGESQPRSESGVVVH